jgi:hypothetical protein
MNNTCTFSLCRRYRYTLEHVIDEAAPLIRDRRIQWIGLNPSTADEQQLDNTLRRIRSFSCGLFWSRGKRRQQPTATAAKSAQPSDLYIGNWVVSYERRWSARVIDSRKRTNR